MMFGMCPASLSSDADLPSPPSGLSSLVPPILDELAKCFAVCIGHARKLDTISNRPTPLPPFQVTDWLRPDWGGSVFQ